MKKALPAYEKIDMEHWPRREHFTYYRNSLKCGYSLTAKIDVTKILQFARSHKKRFFGCFLYAVSKTVNMMDSMRMMRPLVICGRNTGRIFQSFIKDLKRSS